MLNVNISKNIGFCFGVERAVKMAEELLDKNEKVYITGDLIHNEEEMNRLEMMGLRTLDIESKTWPDLSEAIVLIRAHGIPLSTREKLKKRAKKVVDATCPVVSNVAQLMKEEREKGYKIYLFGRKGHAEVEYLRSCVENVEVISLTSLPALDKKVKKIALFSQTTMDVDGFQKAAGHFLNQLRSFSEFHIHNTICSVTVEREEEVKELARANDVCIVVGGKKSSNTRKLLEIAKKINKNSYLVLNSDEIKAEWFSSAKNVGICSGTSTPQQAIKGVMERLRKIKN
ncbi:4-hydroxy-3-methylbut-2-enyl diphosphate reductase [Mesoaciditoga sp.]